MDKLMMMENELKGKKVELHTLDKDRIALGVVDMVNGFVNEGVLASSRVRK